MALTEARKKANAKYEAKAYDKTLIRLPKGRLDEIRTHIEPAGESLNGFIGRAISETMERDGGTAADSEAVQEGAGTAQAGRIVYQVPAGMPSESPQQAAGTAQKAGAVSLPPDTLEAAQQAAERTGEAPAVFIARAIETQAKRDKISLQMGLNPVTGGKLKREA